MRLSRTRVVCEALTANLRASESARRLKTVCLLELLVKNCDMKLHRSLFTEKFCATVLKILEKVS